MKSLFKAAFLFLERLKLCKHFLEQNIRGNSHSQLKKKTNMEDLTFRTIELLISVIGAQFTDISAFYFTDGA